MAASAVVLGGLIALPSPPSQAATTGFVTRNGTDFALSGQPYRFAGANIYWLSQVSAAQRDAALDAAKAQGVTVIRTWGFADYVNPSDAGSGVYFQTYNSSTGQPVINGGANGLGKLDGVIKAANDRDLRLIITLTNNWGDYGGMDKYGDWLNRANGTPQNHHRFFTNSTIRSWFKTYANTLINRSNNAYSTPRTYKNDPTIMGWELANEPRCGDCPNKPGDVTAWATDMASYVKAQAPQQLVSVGDEGFKCGGGSYPDDCTDGIDTVALTGISSVDFGSAHLYPGHWGYGGNAQSWGNSWITSRAAISQAAGKPFVLGEFGVDSNQASTYSSWYGTLANSTADGDMIWQIAQNNPPYSDQFTIQCPSNTSVCPLIAQHSTAMGGPGGTGNPPGNGGSAIAGFESSTEGWTGSQLAGGPWQVTEWSSQGSGSLKADVDLATNGGYYLHSITDRDLSTTTSLKVTARVAPWGNHAGGTQAMLYIKTGPSWTWYQATPVTVSSTGTTLTFNISSVPNRNTVKEIGVKFLGANGSSGRSAIYIDDVAKTP